jgi:hypothetical protein
MQREFSLHIRHEFVSANEQNKPTGRGEATKLFRLQQPCSELQQAPP